MKRWPLNETYFWERIPFLRVLLPLIVGITLYPFVATALTMNVLWLIITVIISCCFLFLKQKNSVVKTLTFIAVHCGIVCTAWLLCHYHDIRNDRDWFGRYTKCDGFVAKVSGTPIEKEKSFRLNVTITHAVQGQEVKPVKGDAVVYMMKYDAPVVREGDVIIIPAKWHAVANHGNPFEFDYATYLKRRNIYLQQFVSGKEIIVYSYGDEQLSWIRQLHHWCIRQLEWYITDPATQGLMKAMLMNDTVMLDEDLEKAYADTGIVHIIAISGGHIAVFFVVVAALLAWVRHRKYQWVKYTVAIPLIWLYVVVAGAPPSAVRAAMMFSILGVGFAMQKQPNGINQLLATAFILLCANPTWLYDIGFQLSFIAVLSIMIFYKQIRGWMPPGYKILRTLWSAVAVSIAAEILVAPLVIYYFHLFPIQFIVANVLAWLFMGVVLVLGLLIIALSPVHTVAKGLAVITEWLVAWFNKIVYRLQTLNFDSFSRLTLNDVQLILVYISIVCMAIFFIKKQKQALFAGLIACCLFLAASCLNQWNVLHQQQLIVYNTAKGCYTELITGKTATVINERSSIDKKTTNYILQPAHINMHIEEQRNTKANYINIGGKSVFIIAQPIVDTVLHADYAILAYAAKKKDLEQLQQVFPKSKLVITNSVNRNAVNMLQEEAKRLAWEVHTINHDGAFVLSSK